MGLSIGGIVCTITLKLLACPEKVPPPLPPIQAAQLDNDPAKVLELAQQLVATGTKPRNLIVFIADGMDPTLVAAARARIAQPAPLPLDQTLPPSAAPDAAAELDPSSAQMSAGGSAVAASGPAVADPAAPVPVATARSDRLSFELFPDTAVSKTDRESIEAHNYAGAVSALLTGTETSPSIIGMNAKAVPDQCPKPAQPVPPEDPAVAPAKGKDSVATDSKDQAPALRENEVPTLLERAKDVGFVAGFVSTSRVTAAVPAATYAHAANRNWEIDSRMPQAALDAGCRDIARQLIEFDRHAKPDAKFDELAAKLARKASNKSGVVLDLKGLAARHGGLDVIMGGGRLAFLPEGMPDPVNPTRRGVRKPVGQGGVHLIEQWKERNPDGVLVTGASALEQNVQTAGPMLGLFSPDHMAFENDRMQQGVDQPSLGTMVEAAIIRLSRGSAGSQRGYILIVDAGGIDRATITGQGDLAIGEVLALSEAIAKAAAKTSDRNDTLIVVAAIHGQTIVQREPGKTKLVKFDGEDALVYARGPGAQWIHGVINASTLHNVLVAAMQMATPQMPAAKK